MEQLSLTEILHCVDGQLVGDRDRIVTSVSTNSKEINENALFIPIKGERFDGHDFILDAYKNGASVVFTEKHLDNINPNYAYIKVEDTLEAFQMLAACYRLNYKIPVVGVTGSVGKTTTKEMISSVLSKKFNVTKTSGNLNGQIGVPATIFNINNNTDVAVVEMGMNQFGEMGRIARIVKPNIAVLSNIGISHIENLHTQENILAEKLRIADYIKEDGLLVFNGDDKILSAHDFSKYNAVSYGINENCDCVAKNIITSNGSTSFTVEYKGINTTITLPVMGLHCVYNALAAIVVATYLDVDIEKIKLGFSEYQSPKMRQQIHTFEKIDLIDDSYNASPDSMRSSIDLLKLVSKNKTSIAVLADMFELGEESLKSHIEIGKYVSDNNIDILVTVGEMAKNMANEIGGYTQVKSFLSNQDAANYVLENLSEECSILVKGSRGMKTDEIVKTIIKELESK